MRNTRCFMGVLICCGFILSLMCAAPVFAQASAEKAWKILEGGIADKSQDQRVKALRALGLLWEDKRAEQFAEKALSDEKPEVRAAAARALGEMGARSSAPQLKEALKDKKAAVVVAAADALFRLQDEIAFSVYYAVLMGEKKTGESLMESQLKMLKDPKALASVGIAFVPYAGAGMAVLKMATRDDTSPLRAAAALKLSKDPDPRSGQALAQSAQDPKWVVRAAVMDAIAKRGDATLLDAVVPLLDDKDDTVRFNAAATVVRLTTIKGQ